MTTDKEYQIINKNYKKQKQRKKEFEEYREMKTQEGNDFQKLVEALLKEFFKWNIICYKTQKEQYHKGENKAGVEIKHDNKLKNTGKLFIEYAEKAEKRGGLYALGGILKNDNSWLYVIGDYKEIYGITIKTLRRIYEKNKKRTKYPWVENQTKTSLGFLIPKKKALKICLWSLQNQESHWKRHINKKKVAKKDIWKL